ncbi:MAG: hypothetical protein ABFR02_03005 [Campylobacterota bacterium]
MKKVLLSTLAAMTLSGAAFAETMTLYTDPKTGQVFTTSGEGREEMGDFVSAKEVYLQNQEQDSVIAKKESKKKETSVFAKASKLKFSGTHYLGYNYMNVDGQDATGNFEMRRNYVQVKAYVLEDPKSYLRVTLDATYSNSKQADADGNYDGYAKVFVKYAYLYLDEVLPYTGMEFGMVHRPWIDYEEHQGWWMRSISKVFVEASEASHLTNSADLGFNIKTKTPYFTSEIGVFNGEGYHGQNDSDEEHIGTGNSAEWRFTGAFLGNGEKKRKPLKDSYLDASFFGQYNMDNSKNANATIAGEGEEHTYVWYGLHAVYNMPSLLVSAQYVISDNENKETSEWNGSGYSVNGTFRFGEKKQFSVIGRYDVWTSEDQQATVTEQTTNSAIYGVAWQQNKNVKWLLSGQSFTAKDGRNYKSDTKSDWNSAMLTAEVHW